MKSTIRFPLFIFILATESTVGGFLYSHSGVTKSSVTCTSSMHHAVFRDRNQGGGSHHGRQTLAYPRRPNSHLGLSNKNDYQSGRSSVDGRGTGLILLGLAVAASVWLFSIPPEFRRARICTDVECSKDGTVCCITPKAWLTGVADFYRNGGGIEWDFSIDPATIAKNEAMREQMISAPNKP